MLATQGSLAALLALRGCVPEHVNVGETARWWSMGPVRVLVVEDERLLADAIAEWLRADAHAVDVANDGEAALERIGVNDYDVVVLDRDLPIVHGDDVCRALVASESSVRVLMLTAAAEIGDRVAGLSLGADDYLSKPFNPTILRARIGAALRTKEGRVLEAFFVNRPLDDVSHLQATKTNQPREEAIK
jgi:DNA-binding response OmpR family regulator